MHPGDYVKEAYKMVKQWSEEERQKWMKGFQACY